MMGKFGEWSGLALACALLSGCPSVQDASEITTEETDGLKATPTDQLDPVLRKAYVRTCKPHVMANVGKTDVTFVAFGDAQIMQPKGMENDSDQNDLNVKAINDLPNHDWPKVFKESGKIRGIRGVLMAGDITEYGGTMLEGTEPSTGPAALPVLNAKKKPYKLPDKTTSQTEADKFYDTYGLCGDPARLIFPMYEGYGNHDFHRNAPYNFKHPVIDRVGKYNPLRADRTRWAEPAQGAHYAWKWDNIHFINLNLKAGDMRECIPVGKSPPLKGDDDPDDCKADPDDDENGAHVKRIDPGHPLVFLKQYLGQLDKTPGAGVVLMFHYPLPDIDNFKDLKDGARNRAADIKAFIKIIKHYNVLAIIVGHTHKTKQYSFLGIPVFNVGGPYYMSDDSNKAGHLGLFRITNDTIWAADVQWTVKNGKVSLEMKPDKDEFGADDKFPGGWTYKGTFSPEVPR